MAKRKKNQQTRPPLRKNQTYTFGIFALAIGIMIFLAMYVTQSVDHQDALQIPTQEELEERHDTSAGVKEPLDPSSVDPVFAAVSFGAVVGALALISWVKGEGIWLGVSGVALCAAGVWLEIWWIILIVSAVLIVAAEFLSRRKKPRPAKAD